MKRIVLSTSTSCLDYLEVPHHVQSIHQHLVINNVSFLDGHNISIDRLQRLIFETPDSTMRTAPATEDEMMTIFRDLQAKHYDEVLVITHSIRLSESYAIITAVKDKFLASSGSHMRIDVIDSKQINFAQGLMALDAADMYLKGASVPDIQAHLDDLNQHHETLFVVDDLSYLIKSKRLSAPAGFVANLFDIKPMLEIQKDGKIEAVKKVRKLERAIDMMVETMGQAMGNNKVFPYILNAGNPDLANYTAQVIESHLGFTDVLQVPVSPVSVATHGPNTVGFGAFIGTVPKSAALFAKH